MLALRRLILAVLVFSPTIVVGQSQQAPVEHLRAEIAKLTVTQCENSLPVAVRAVNERLLERRREAYASLLEESIAQVKEYVIHTGIELTEADKKDLDDATSPLEAELARAREPLANLCLGPSTPSPANTVLASIDQPILRPVVLRSPAVNSAVSRPRLESDPRPTTPSAPKASAPAPAPDPRGDPPAPYLMGPVRAYFAGGAVLAAESNQFQNSAVFVSLNVDTTVSRREDDPKGWQLILPRQINTYFDARLTTLPVASCVQGTTSASGCTPTSSSGLIDTFNASKKSALISGGLYFPYYAKLWEKDQTQDGHAFFLAPLVKGGFQTLVDPTQTTNTPAGGTQTTFTTLQNKSFFHYFGTGARLGLYSIHKGDEKIPADPIIYLDLVGGKWENFAQTDPKTGAILDHPWRIGLEGRFRVPGLPFMIGFDSNTRTGNSAGDLRFLFGTTFDIGCLYQKLKLSGTAKQVAGCESKQ